MTLLLSLGAAWIGFKVLKSLFLVAVIGFGLYVLLHQPKGQNA